MYYFFKDKDFKGKSILVIGGGDGKNAGHFIHEYDASCATVVDLYPGYSKKYEEIINLKEKIGNKIKVVKCDIWNFSTEEKFGLILAKSSLHHIAKSKKRLSRDHYLKQRVESLFKRIGGWLEDDGKFVILETARRNWSPIPIYRSRKKEIDYSTKQDPWDWCFALKEAGFKNVQIIYPVPSIFKNYKWMNRVFNNYFVCILTGSNYLIEASDFEKKKEFEEQNVY